MTVVATWWQTASHDVQELHDDDAEKERLDVVQSFELKEKEKNRAIEMFAVTTENKGMENFLRTIKYSIKTGNGVGVPVRLRRQA